MDPKGKKRVRCRILGRAITSYEGTIRLRMHRHLEATGIKTFTMVDMAEALEANRSSLPSILNKGFKRGDLYRTRVLIHIPGQNNATRIYTIQKKRRIEEYKKYLIDHLSEYPDVIKAYERINEGEIQSGAELIRSADFKYIQNFQRLGLISKKDWNDLLTIVKERKKKASIDDSKIEESFPTVTKMLNAGLCKTRSRGLQKVDAECRIGMPDDDKILTYDEVSRLIDAVKPEDKPIRLLFGLMFRTGARIFQNLAIRVRDVDFESKRVFIRRAKEGNSFYRYLDDGFLNEAAEYIRHYGLKPNDYLFSVRYVNRFHKSWILCPYPLNRRTAARWLDIYARKAGIQYCYIDEKGYKRRRIHCHTAKYTVCSWIYSQCKDSLVTALTVGNRTTAIMAKHYIKFPSEYKKGVVEQALKGLEKPAVEIMSKLEVSNIESRLLQE